MELILISDTKLKIMLDESEMKKYRIGGEDDYSGGSTGKAIRSILDCARDQIGFNTEGVEIFVQLYTSARGGCELFVTKCPSDKDDVAPLDSECILPTSIAPKEKKSRRTSEKTTAKANDSPQEEASLKISRKSLPAARERKAARLAYSFPSVGDLINVCKALYRLHRPIDSQAFCDEEGNFYLLLLNAGVSAYSRLDALTFITEFGRRENPDCVTSYINEHGSIICEEKAIETLASL